MYDIRGHTVNSRERQSALVISRIMRAGRKSSGFTQMALSKRLAVTQGTLSKFESALLIPSAPQWFDFSDLTQIPDRSFVLGYIDRASKSSSLPQISSEPFECGFKLPARYAKNRGALVRGIYFLLHFAETKMGTKRYEKYLESKGLDADFFVNLNHLINHQFIYDLLEELLHLKLLQPEDFKLMLKNASKPEGHGWLHEEYDKSGSQMDLFVRGLRHSPQYDLSFQFEIQEEKGVTTILISPGPHAAEFKCSEEGGVAFCEYRRTFVEEFSNYLGFPKLRFESLECYYRGDARCVYRSDRIKNE
jgi:hypothetical protein